MAQTIAPRCEALATEAHDAAVSYLDGLSTMPALLIFTVQMAAVTGFSRYHHSQRS